MFLGNFKAAGTGITLTKAKTCGILELIWNPGDIIQAEDRIHRITQHDPVMIYYFVAKNTIEEPLCKILQDKQSILDQVLDGKEGLEDFNIFDEIKKVILKDTL